MPANTIYVGASGLNMLAAEFERKGSNAKRDAVRAATHWGALTVAAVRAHAQGRPGPEVITGDYLNSIQYDTGYSAMWGTGIGISGFSVGSDAPQAMRLELGFVGTDSAGRTYNQPPFPHYGPAADEIDPAWVLYMEQFAELDIMDIA